MHPPSSVALASFPLFWYRRMLRKHFVSEFRTKDRRKGRSEEFLPPQHFETSIVSRDPKRESEHVGWDLADLHTADTRYKVTVCQRKMSPYK